MLPHVCPTITVEVFSQTLCHLPSYVKVSSTKTWLENKPPRGLIFVLHRTCLLLACLLACLLLAKMGTTTWHSKEGDKNLTGCTSWVNLYLTSPATSS